MPDAVIKIGGGAAASVAQQQSGSMVGANKSPIINGGGSLLSSTDPLPRLRGLTNLGNTCFFNAVMQCLGQTPFLSTIFKDKVVLPGGTMPFNENETKDLPPIPVPYNSNVEEIIPAFKDILDELQTPGGVHNPKKFFHQFTKTYSQFGGGDQHDSHELLRHLLDSVICAERHTYHKLIASILVKGRRPNADELKTMQFYANQAKDRYLIERVFQGSLESTLRCQDCMNTSPNMEKFLDISLPIIVEPSAMAAAAARPMLTAGSSGDAGGYMRQRNSPEPPAALTKRQLKKEKRKTKRDKKYASRTDNEGVAKVDDNSDNSNDESNDENSDNSSSELNRNDSDEELLCNNIEMSLSISDRGKSELIKKHLSTTSIAADRNAAAAATENSNSKLSDVTVVKQQNDQEQPKPTTEKCVPEDVAEIVVNIETDLVEAATQNTIINDNSIFVPSSTTTTTTSSTNGPAESNSLINDNGNNSMMMDLMSPSSPAPPTPSATQDNVPPKCDPSVTIGRPYVAKPKECSVQSCLNGFIVTELLSGNNKVGCEACTRRINGEGGKTVNTNATKQFLVSSLPAVLILHLKRFQLGSRHSFRKLDTQVTFPVQLDMGPFCAATPQISKKHRTVNRKQKKILYSLYGVVEHSGSMHGGHYIAYVKVRPKLQPSDPRWKFVSKLYNEQQRQPNGGGVNGASSNNGAANTTNGYDSDDSVTSSPDEEDNVTAPPGKWFYASDSHVREVSEEKVLNAEAYLLFYERIY